MTAPWLDRLEPEHRAVVRDNAAAAPPLTDRQRNRLRLLFHARTTGVIATTHHATPTAAQQVRKVEGEGRGRHV